MDPMATSNTKLSGTPGRCNPHAIDLRGPFPGGNFLHRKDMERPGGNIQISSQSFSGWDKLEVSYLIFHILKGSNVGLVFSDSGANRNY